MKNRLALIFFIFLLLLSCKKNELENKTLDLGQIRVQVPINWESFSRQGYDSAVGVITNGKDELLYDYGWYAYDLKKETSATYIRTTTIISNKPALIVQPKERGQGLIGVYIEADSLNKLTIYGQDIQDESTVLKIFASVKL